MQEGDFLVERYRVVRKLGNGAMGQVWLAHDALLNRHVAIKHLLAGSQESLNDELVQRAMREARLAAQLNHAYAVQIFDLIIDRGVPHVVMEYVEGETLANRLPAGRVAPHVIRPVIRQVAAALAVAHELGIVHRDVKPANILIAANGVAKLADFGIARASHDTNLTSTGLVIGTLAYMAPEVAAGDPATPASDVWALGATAYAATEGRAPFAGESSARMLYRKVTEPPPLPTGAGELSELVRAMMATEPAERPVARDVARALEGSGPPSWAGAPRPEAEPTTVRRVVPESDGTVRRVVQESDRTVLRGTRQHQATIGPVSQLDHHHKTDARRAEPRHRRGGLIAAGIALAVAIIAGGAVAFVLTTRFGGKTVAGATRSSEASRTAPLPQDQLALPTSLASTSPHASAPSNQPRATQTSGTAVANTPTRWLYRTYSNARFKFSLQIPANFTALSPPENGDGLGFESPDHQAQVIAYGANNALADTPAGALKQCSSLVRSEGGQVTYSYVQHDFYICTGYKSDGSIFYQRTVVYPRAEYSVQWTYARKLKNYLDPPVQRSVTTFRPGPNEGG